MCFRLAEPSNLSARVSADHYLKKTCGDAPNNPQDLDPDDLVTSFPDETSTS